MTLPVGIRAGPQAYVVAIVLGLALADARRLAWAGALALAAVVGTGSANASIRRASLCTALGLSGWWWGSARLDALDRSALLRRVGTAERSQLVVTGPARRGPFQLRLPAEVQRFGLLSLHERVLLELPLGRAPPQGAVIDAVCTVRLPRGRERGFDERAWLRRQGVHVVMRAERWRMVGRRGGLGGVADRLRRYLASSAAPGLEGERRALIAGVVLGEDAGLTAELRRRFRASGLYHLLAVSGQNVALVAGGVLGLTWLLGVPRWLGEVGALAGILGYVLAVGAQPSVIRAGIAGALGSLAWLAARPRDRWHFLALGALGLLAWNPYTLLDPGFQLSFSAVVAIFVLSPRIDRRLEGYPLPRGLRAVLSVSTACGIATAPVLWLQFHAVPLLSVPANALAAPAVVPLLGLALASAAVMPVSPSAAAALAWANGWCAAYLAACARVVGGLPFAQVRSGAVMLGLAAAGLLAAAYAWRRWPD